MKFDHIPKANRYQISLIQIVINHNLSCQHRCTLLFEKESDNLILHHPTRRRRSPCNSPVAEALRRPGLTIQQNPPPLQIAL